MKKRGELVWDKLGKWILALVLLLILLFIALNHKTELLGLLEDLETIFRFGGR